MNIVIIGGGKIGETLVKCLEKEGHNIVVIEKNKNVLDNILNNYDVAGIVGNGAVVSVQNEAQVNKADIFISVTDNDELNLVCCKVARSLGAKKVVARVRDTEYTDQTELMRIGFGVDEIVNPELATAEEIANLLRFPFATSAISFEKGKVVCVEIRVPNDCAIANKSIKRIVKNFGAELIIGAICRNGKAFIPNGDDKIMADDFVNFISTPKQIDAFFKKAGIFNQRVKSVLVVGGSRISYHLVHKLQEVGIKVKIIERDEARCNYLVSTLDKVEIVCANGTQKQVLDEEGLKDYDACVSLTNIDEQNIIISLYAKSKNVGTVISKVNNNAFGEILEDINLDTTISPKNIAADQIIYFARLEQEKGNSAMESLHKLMNDDIELLELNIGEDNILTEKPIKDLGINENIIIAGIKRDNDFLVPTGNTVIKEGDKIIVVTTFVIETWNDMLK